MGPFGFDFSRVVFINVASEDAPKTVTAKVAAFAVTPAVMIIIELPVPRMPAGMHTFDIVTTLIYTI